MQRGEPFRANSFNGNAAYGQPGELLPCSDAYRSGLGLGQRSARGLYGDGCGSLGVQNQMPKWEEARNQKAQTTPLTYRHPRIQPQNFPPHRHHEIMNEDLYNLTRRRADSNHGSSVCATVGHCPLY